MLHPTLLDMFPKSTSMVSQMPKEDSPLAQLQARLKANQGKVTALKRQLEDLENENITLVAMIDAGAKAQVVKP